MKNVDEGRLATLVRRNKTGSYSVTKQIWSTQYRRYISDVRVGKPASFNYRPAIMDLVDAHQDGEST